MAIKETPIPRIRHSLTHSELIILRSIALGLGCDTVRDLLELSMNVIGTLSFRDKKK
jgi:hypothetical protein